MKVIEGLVENKGYFMEPAFYIGDVPIESILPEGKNVRVTVEEL